MYPYDEDLELVRRYSNDFPLYQIDAKGNPFNPKKQINGSEYLKPRSILHETPKQSLVNQTSLMKNKSSVNYLHKITNENTQKLAKAFKDLKIDFRHLITFKNSLIDSPSLDL